MTSFVEILLNGGLFEIVVVEPLLQAPHKLVLLRRALVERGHAL